MPTTWAVSMTCDVRVLSASLVPGLNQCGIFSSGYVKISVRLSDNHVRLVAVLYFDASGYVNGQSIGLDGGQAFLG